MSKSLVDATDTATMERGTEVIVHGLTSTAGLLLNNKHGTLGGPIPAAEVHALQQRAAPREGGTKLGWYHVFFNGEKGHYLIKACNVSPASVAGATLDDDAATGAVTDMELASGLARAMELAKQRGIHLPHPRNRLPPGWRRGARERDVVGADNG